MLTYVPVRFDAYRPLKSHLRWSLQCLVSFADRAGRCFPSVRKLATFAGLSKSAVSRHLAALEREGAITRRRRPGSVYEYQIAARFLPRAPVSHQRAEGVPQQSGQETEPSKQIERARPRARFAKPGLIEGLPDPNEQWQQRVRTWLKSGGKFWLPAWGAKPNEPGCLAPAALLQNI
jgi:DNA-binding transcriptional ArsR family regulator